ncbi:hypothetical protein CYY_010131 [Polysphondylium violaceum]|uniref:RNA 3'-terminal-phosphate cyclase (ATP) n=1 Tax=Polysphondylium violaceum TaxID=133409 RepID=A0A8J4PKC5_9MYCE|nr:hypothetical protein CYY_010131 [Polysphondylium violaceum]
MAKKHNKPHLKKSKIDTPTESSSSTSTSTTTIIEEKPDFEIDGSVLEGGGQILRNSIALASLYNKCIEIINIRKGRDAPGLKAQHKTGIDLMAKLYKAHLSGSKCGSTRVYYKPMVKEVNIQETIEADTKTAGSMCLLIQVSLPCLLFSNGSSKMVLGGGTNADFAPSADYMMRVFFPIASRMGIDSTLTIDKRGFYPRGCGQMTMITKNLTEPLKPITMLEKGNVVKITIQSYYTAKVSPLVAERMNNTAKKMFKKDGDFKKVDIETEMVDISKCSFGDGAFIFITAYTDTGCIYGATSNGSIGVPAEKVAEDATDIILKDLQDGGCVDEYLQDQLIIFMALAKGKSEIKTGPISLHTQTSILFTSKFTGAEFIITPCENRKLGEETFIITCNGIGYLPSSSITTTTTTTNSTLINNNNSNITTITTTAD